MSQAQTTGQAETENREIVPTRKRGPEDGNVLWRLYLDLGLSSNKAFRQMMDELPLGMVTFFKYSKLDHPLGRIDMRYFMAFREFFLEHNQHDIMGDFLDEQEAPTHFTALPH